MEGTPEKKVKDDIVLNEKTPDKKVKDAVELCEKTPEKVDKSVNINNMSTPKRSKDISQLSDFKTPEKAIINSKDDNKVKNDCRILYENKTPIKENEQFNLKTEKEIEMEQLLQNDIDDGMISTTEQARILIAATKTPSKGINKTPDKKMTPNGKRSLNGSPITPGKFRRVELITLSSPKTKRFKQI